MSSWVVAGLASILGDETGALHALDAIAHRVCAFAIKPRHAHAIKRFTIHFSANDFWLLSGKRIAITLRQTRRE